MPIQSSSYKPDSLSKPLLRGHFHQAAFFIAVGACSMLIAKSADDRAMIATLIYSACLLNLFGTSALYHRPNWNPRQRSWMRRLDHSAIFLLIAGTATPICLLALSEESGLKALTLVWVAALFGVTQAVFWLRATKWLTAFLAILTGWLITPFAQEVQEYIGTHNVASLVVGGVIYTIGAIIYAFKRPDPFPKYCGYHEIFHILVVLAATLHFVVIARIAT